MNISVATLIFGAVMAAMTFVFTAIFSKNALLSIVNAVLAFLAFWLLTGVLAYISMPVWTGVWDGYGFFVWATLIVGIPFGVATAISTAIINLRSDGGDKYDSDIPDAWIGYVGNLVMIVVIFVVVWGLIGTFIQNIGATWGDGNMQRYVKAANVTIAGTQMPASDPSHIVMVTPEMAAYEGQQALATTGQNLGSRFHFAQDQYILQSVTVSGRPTLYYVAPMTYNNVQQQADQYDTPGYVMVNAENPNTAPILVEKDLSGNNIEFHYVPGLFGERDLLRHVYDQGYNNCNLEDATVEVDDNLHAWWTILCAGVLNGFEGDTLDRVLIVDPQSGVVHSYAPGHQPTWVDRVVPQSTAEYYTDQWGRFRQARWLDGGNHANEQIRAGSTEILYNFTGGSDRPVYLMAMTSNSDNDTSSTGFMAYDTQTLAGTYYPLAGIQVGEPVQNAFDHFSQNIQHYPTADIRFYDLYGEPTWVAIYEQPNSQGATFEAIGFVDARNLSGNNVVWGNTLNQALENYQNMLATEGNNTQSGTSKNGGKTLTGTLLRLSVQTVQNVTTYTFLVSGSNKVFTAVSSLVGAKYLNVAQVGDKVTITYNDAGFQTVAVTSFDDVTVEQLLSATPTPSPSPSPTPSH